MRKGGRKREREREKGMSEAPVGTPIVKVTVEYRGPGKEIVSQTDRKLPQDATVTTVTHIVEVEYPSFSRAIMALSWLQGYVYRAKFALSLSHSLSLSLSLTHSLTRSLTHSLSLPLSLSLTHSPTLPLSTAS